MGFNTETLALIDAAIATRIAGGSVESYTIGSTNIAMCKLSDLFKIREQLAVLAADETAVTNGGSRVHLVNLRPTR